MKKVLNLKNILSVALAMFAVSVMAFNSAAVSNINQIWKVENVEAFFNNDASELEKYDGVVFDLRKEGTFALHYKLKESGSWQKIGEGEYTVTPTDEVSGSVKLQDVEYSYMLENGKMTLSDGSKTLTLTAMEAASSEENSGDPQTTDDESNED